MQRAPWHIYPLSGLFYFTHCPPVLTMVLEVMGFPSLRQNSNLLCSSVIMALFTCWCCSYFLSAWILFWRKVTLIHSWWEYSTTMEKKKGDAFTTIIPQNSLHAEKACTSGRHSPCSARAQWDEAQQNLKWDARKTKREREERVSGTPCLSLEREAESGLL